MIIATITPNNHFVHWDFVKCLLSLVGYEFYTISSASLPDNRNKAYQYAKKMNDDLLFIDSDIVFTYEDIRKMQIDLAEMGASVVSGIYMLENKKPAIFQRKGKNYKYTKPGKGMTIIGACGGGFMGISKRVYPFLPDAPFENLWEGAIMHGEDISFCHRVNEAGLTIWCDDSIRLGHIRTKTLYA